MSTWPLALVLALAACRPPPPEPLPREPELEPPAFVETPASRAARPGPNRVIALAPRPDIDLSTLVPDPTHELRWPLSLSDHPELEPQFEIAAALAEPGVGWLDLCRMGAHNRHLGKRKRDHVAYLRAWCSVGTHDLDGALANLRPLAGSVVSGIAPAVRTDLANILVSSGDAADARRLIAKHRVTDLAVLDTLSASYVEIGKLDDAFEINELALATDDRRNKANRCRRLTRRILLRPPPKQIKAVDLPNAGLFDIPKGADDTCTRLENELACWLEPASGCDEYFKDQKLDETKAQYLLSAYHGWPRGPHIGHWWETARFARSAMPHPGADVLAVTALANAMRVVECTSQSVREIVALAAEIRETLHDPVVDPELHVIIHRPTQLCLNARK